MTLRGVARHTSPTQTQLLPVPFFYLTTFQMEQLYLNLGHSELGSFSYFFQTYPRTPKRCTQWESFTSIISIRSFVPDERWRCLKPQLFHRFLFLLLKPLIRASFNGFISSSITYFPRPGMVAADQSEEWFLMCLKIPAPDMYFSRSVLPSRLRSKDHAITRSCDGSSLDDSAVLQTLRIVYVRKNIMQLTNYLYGEWEPSMTVRQQLSLSLHHRTLHLPNSQLASRSDHMIQFSAYDLPPMFDAFAGLWSAPFNL